MKRKPLFRFVGTPAGGIRSQYDAAHFAQEFFFVLRDAGLNGTEREITERFGGHVSRVREELRKAGVVVAEPEWFARLLR